MRWFPNRWPAMDGDRCEVVLYTPDHDAAFGSLSREQARRVVELWADRTERLGQRPDVSYVLVFENRGPEVGATIAHPHGQIYAYDHVPSRQARRLAAGWLPDLAAGERHVAAVDGWVAWVPYAPTFPVAIEIAPTDPYPDLMALGRRRGGLADMLVDVLSRLDRLFGRRVPYMMWLNQRPTVASGYADGWFNVEIVSPWRAAGLERFIAAAEVASDEYFNPVIPEELAAKLRAAR